MPAFMLKAADKNLKKETFRFSCERKTAKYKSK